MPFLAVAPLLLERGDACANADIKVVVPDTIVPFRHAAIGAADEVVTKGVSQLATSRRARPEGGRTAEEGRSSGTLRCSGRDVSNMTEYAPDRIFEIFGGGGSRSNIRISRIAF